jgi:hypothetical protein
MDNNINNGVRRKPFCSREVEGVLYCRASSQAELRQKTLMGLESKPCCGDCMVEVKGEFCTQNLSRTCTISPDGYNVKV